MIIMKNRKSFENRIKSEARATGRITNQDLICRDCVSRFDDRIRLGNTSTCKEYRDKPNSVLLGGHCDKYKKEGEDDEDSVRM